jgi:type VI secretion system secreted protein Hcp
MKKLIFVLLGVLTICNFNLLTASDSEATEIFVRIEGINGESHDDRHKDWIDATSISDGVSQPRSGSVYSGGARTAARANFADIMIEKKIDASSPLLFKACATGNHIKRVRIDLVRSSAKGKYIFAQYQLDNVIISSVTTSFDQETNDFKELVTFNFGTITQNYNPLRPDGSFDRSIQAGWDVERNVAF